MAKKAAYVGAGSGIALFAIIGLLPASLIGGGVGIKIAEVLFGSPVTSQLFPRSDYRCINASGCFRFRQSLRCLRSDDSVDVGELVDSFPVVAYFTGRRKSKKAKGNDSGKKISE